MAKDATYYVQRLRDNRDAAQERLDKALVRHAALQDQGVDTSTFDPRTSAQSPDHTIRQLTARLEFAQKELDKYLAKHPEQKEA